MPTPTPALLHQGVAAFDHTPAPGRLWGRLRGLALVVDRPEGTLAVVALDGARIPQGTTEQVETALGWPSGTVALWTGGPARVAVPVDVLVHAIQRARSDARPGRLCVSVGPAFGLRSAVEDSSLLAGQRLERSHRQLRARAPDDRLEALVERLHQAPPPPGVAWGQLLVDQRVALIESLTPDGQLRGAIGWLPGTDPFAGGGWPSAGIRGALARRLSAEALVGEQAAPPVVVVGPEAPGRLGGARRPARDASEARVQCESGAEAFAKVVRRLRDGAHEVAPSELFTANRAVSHPGGGRVDVGMTGMGPLRVLHLPSTLSVGMDLRLRTELAVESLLWVRTAEVGPATIHTPREAHQRDDADDQLGPWLVDCLTGLPTAGVPVPPPDTTPAGPGRPEDPVPEAPAPHVVASLRRGHGPRGSGRTLELSVRLRPEAMDPPGDRWQVCLEWERGGEWTLARVQGLPVDDQHQGMRLVLEETRSGPVLQVRWSVAELRRWAGRRFRVRVGPAFGGPYVSEPFRLK